MVQAQEIKQLNDHPNIWHPYSNHGYSPKITVNGPLHVISLRLQIWVYRRLVLLLRRSVAGRRLLEELNISAPATSGDYITHTSEGVEKYFLEFLADTPDGKTSIQKYTEWANKKEKCPTWITVIRRSGVKTWNELLTKFGMKPVMVMSSKRSIETHERLVQAVRDYVDATRGGSLSLDDFYGWVDANLGTGDVEAFKNIIVTKYSSDWVSVLKASAN